MDITFVTDEGYEQLYGQLCDALCRIFWAERYNIEPYGEPNDGVMHTSSAARSMAIEIMQMARIMSPSCPIELDDES